MAELYKKLQNKFFIIAGPNVIESEEHVFFMASELKNIFEKYDIEFIFKVSFDKANRSSNYSYRGLGIEKGIEILKKIKESLNIPIITDIHEPYQAELLQDVVDIIQIPAFLCRQTDLLKAAAKTNKIIHIKKGQMCTAEQMHKAKEKVICCGNNNVILCERGNSFGYHDLIVDPRNLIWLRSESNLVSMDITHCLQQPSQKDEYGEIKSGGYRDLIPFMGKMAKSLNVNGIFMEIHDNPDKSLCDAPTQWPLDKVEWLLNELNIRQKEKNKKRIVAFVPIKLNSQRLANKMLMDLGNKKLCQYIFETLLDVKKYIDIDLYCFCSNEKIKEYLPNDILFLKREKNLDSNETKGIDIYKSFAKKIDADIYMLCHATSPFIKSINIINGLNKVIDEGYDSSFSVSKIQTFSWFDNKPLNYNFENVVRTQDIKPVYYETSAFYIYEKDVLMKYDRRIGFNPYLINTNRIESIDIDEFDDFELAEKIIK